MRKPAAALGSLLFLLVAPGTVAGPLPWWISGWKVHDLPAGLAWATIPVRTVGIVLIAAGAAFVLSAFVRFVIEGLGTPAPVAPPSKLVVGGVYRYVRNPMYVAVPAMILGQVCSSGRVRCWSTSRSSPG